MKINLKNMSLKGVSTIIIFFLFSLFTGCSDVKVLEEDTSNEEVISINNKDVSITEFEDPYKNLNMSFFAEYIEDGKVYGSLNTRVNGENVTYASPYVFDKNGTLAENKLKEELSSEYKNLKKVNEWSYKGIYTETKEGSEEESYFVNIKDGTKFLLENHKKYEQEIYMNIENQVTQMLIGDNLYLQKNMNYLSYIDEGELYLEKSKRKNQFLLVDENEKKEYISDIMENMPYVFYYKKEHSFMAIDDKGVVYKLVVKNDKIEREEYSTIPLADFGLETLFLDKEANFFSKNNILVFNFLESPKNRVLVYDLETGKWNINEANKLSVRWKIDNSPFFISTQDKKTDYYLERINENLEIEVIAKLIEDEDYILTTTVGNEEENQAFISFNKYLKNASGIEEFEDTKYFYINIKN